MSKENLWYINGNTKKVGHFIHTYTHLMCFSFFENDHVTLRRRCRKEKNEEYFQCAHWNAIKARKRTTSQGTLWRLVVGCLFEELCIWVFLYRYTVSVFYVTGILLHFTCEILRFYLHFTMETNKNYFFLFNKKPFENGILLCVNCCLWFSRFCETTSNDVIRHTLEVDWETIVVILFFDWNFYSIFGEHNDLCQTSHFTLLTFSVCVCSGAVEILNNILIVPCDLWQLQ